MGGGGTPNTTTSTKKKEDMVPDMDSHNGLRGVAALWIVCFHLIADIDLLGPTLMPLFFVLSGFSLAVVYGSRPLKVLGGRGEGAPAIIYKERVAHERCQPFDWKRYYWNRFIRIMPTYYLCTLLAIPPVLAGYDAIRPGQDFINALVVSIIPINTIFNTTLGLPIVNPSWFVATMVWLWLLFPFYLTRAQRFTDAQLVRHLVFYHLLQILLMIGIYYGLTYYYPPSPHFLMVSCASSWSPFSRFPLFLMGIDAGLLCLRHPTGKLPWPSSFLGLLPLPWPSRRAPTTDEKETKRWSFYATYQSLQLFAITVAAILCYPSLRLTYPALNQLNPHIWLTAFLAFPQLEVVVALTRDGGGQSLASRALRVGLLRWLGKIGTALYLIHVPMREYTLWYVQGHALKWPSVRCKTLLPDHEAVNRCFRDYFGFNAAHVLPREATPWVFVLSFVMAALIFYGFEEPIRRSLKKDKVKATTTSSGSSTSTSSRPVEQGVELELSGFNADSPPTIREPPQEGEEDQGSLEGDPLINHNRGTRRHPPTV